MERICIIGGSGTGKTTLSNNLSKELNIAVCHIDGIHHLKNWEIRDKNERDKIILIKTEQDKWIMDGTYRSTLEQRLKKADTVIYLDYSTFTQVIGVLKRFIKNHGKEKEEIPGCKEQMTWKFFWFVIKWRKNKRNEILENLSKIDSSKIHIFKNRRQLNKWYKNTFGKRIEY
ncbi:MAG: hypothetical protein J6J60_08420 [Clostridia bacterium]|nr:hypothetical protein [Clostridia bacterium]